MDIYAVSKLYEKILTNVNTVVVGRQNAVLHAVIALLVRGHVLLEDVPGSGKTLLAKSLAASIGGDFKRIQFTPDLLPSDITGINFLNMKTSEFEFMPGPVFANIVLADEINRAMPKTQAGLLECMEERQVTIDTETHRLPPPFMVIATQNPVDTQGVFPLPEAQLDRFTLKVPMQYTGHTDTVEILRMHRAKMAMPTPVVNCEEVILAQDMVTEVFVHEVIMDYIVSLVEATRNAEGVMLGVSARGALTLMRAAQAMAAINVRDYVLPDDVKALALPVLAHRMILRGAERVRKNAAEELLQSILEKTLAPTEFEKA